MAKRVSKRRGPTPSSSPREASNGGNTYFLKHAAFVVVTILVVGCIQIIEEQAVVFPTIQNVTTTWMQEQQQSYQQVAVTATVKKREDSSSLSSSAASSNLRFGVELSFLHQVAYGRNFSNPDEVVALLTKILEYDEVNKYDPHRNILLFEHPLKTGGTSLSQILKEMGGVIPGSRASGYFNFDEFDESFIVNSTYSSLLEEDKWKEFKVLYSHSQINDGRTYAGKSHSGPSKLEKFLQEKMPSTIQRRFRVLTMIRDPLPYVASNMNEWMCHGDAHLRLAIQTLSEDQRQQMQMVHHHPCYGFTFEQLHQIWLEEYVKPYCLYNITNTKQRNPPNPDTCILVKEKKIPMEDCQSVPIFMSSSRFKRYMHDIFGRAYIPEVHQKYNNNNLSRSKMPANVSTIEDLDMAQAIGEYEHSALERLGGFTAQGDMYMMWHGITERMAESMCLFHFMVGYPYYETPHARNKQCRPTSYYSEKDKQQFRTSEIVNYAMSRAAHAILDVRMAKLCRKLHFWDRNSNNNNTLYQSLPIETCCSNFLFDNEGRIQHYTPSVIV